MAVAGENDRRAGRGLVFGYFGRVWLFAVGLAGYNGWSCGGGVGGLAGGVFLFGCPPIHRFKSLRNALMIYAVPFVASFGNLYLSCISFILSVMATPKRYRAVDIEEVKGSMRSTVNPFCSSNCLNPNCE